MANAWKRDRPGKLLSPKPLLLLLLLATSLLLVTFFFLASGTSNPNPNLTFKTLTLHPTIQPFDCYTCPQAHPIIANVVEGLKHPFLYSLSDFGSLPDKPHKNIARILKGKLFRRPDISVTIQDVLEKLRGEEKNGIFVDVGANVGMATFAAAVMGFRVLSLEPVFENLQRICEGVYFNRVGDLVTVFEAAASDRLGNITFHKLHSKKRNRLEQQRLNDLVYVKYNRTLRFRYDMRNTLDPISLQNIDESNEWLLGRMDGESDEDNEPVFDDDDGLTWATVARASGVEESSHASRATSSRSKAQPRISKSSTLTPLQLIDEEEAGSDDTEEEDVEGYKSTDGEEDDSLLAIDVEDDD